MGDKSRKKSASHAEGRIQTLTLLNSSGTQGSRSVRVSLCIKVGGDKTQAIKVGSALCQGILCRGFLHSVLSVVSR